MPATPSSKYILVTPAPPDSQFFTSNYHLFPLIGFSPIINTRNTWQQVSSSVRRRKDIMHCKLCLEEHTLCDSHIIPEFLYRPGYDEIHRIRVLTKAKASFDLIQKGYREKLLCAKCETTLSTYEDYFAKLWYVQKSLPEVSDGTSVQLSGLDYTLFKLFHLSILWRSSISRLPPFSQLNLKINEEYIRKMILDQQPGSPDDYQIFGELLRYPGSDQVLDGFISSPTLQIFNQRRLFMFVFGGCVWHYYEVFGNPNSLLEKISLSPEGTITLPSKSLEEVGPLHRFFIEDARGR